MTRRSFYEEDELVINKPGYNAEISEELKAKESAHGNISFVEGMGVRTTPFLEQYSNKLRLFLHDKLSIYGAELGTQKSAFVNEVNTISNEVVSVIHEPVLPNLIYILTASLTGSILVSRRTLPLRFVTPVLFDGVALNYYMPKTFDTLSQRYDTFEKETFPEFHQKKQELVSENYQNVKKEVNTGISEAKIALEKVVHDARVYLKDVFEEEEEEEEEEED
ncbi:apolipo protein O-domain-containing protein [Scheffersomyces xylosifermentans]|uniref:apolipo protein O-domain-containing protein n=1 Tax=Scheffersomyces xylosifermentans TaxID=1304137 RepID=UPI00315D8590